MRFVLGLGIGFAVGFAGAILLAPDKERGRRVERPAGAQEPVTVGSPNGTREGLVAALSGLRERIGEAMAEAKEAAKDAQAQTRERLRERVQAGADKPSD